MVRNDADFVSRSVTKRLSMEFDWKRKPVNVHEATVTFDGKSRTHLSFGTQPHASIEAFHSLREEWERYDKKPHRNLKTLKDYERFETYVETHRDADKEVSRYISKEDGDLKRLRRDLCRAFTHLNAGFDISRKVKWRYGQFASALRACGIPCEVSDIDNGKRAIFKAHQTLPTKRVVEAITLLHDRFFPDLEIDTILESGSGEQQTVASAAVTPTTDLAADHVEASTA